MDGRKRNKGSVKRKSWSFTEKAAALELYDAAVANRSEAPGEEAAAGAGCSTGQISTWRRNSKTIIKTAANKKVKWLTSVSNLQRKVEKRGKFWKAELCLLAEIRKKRLMLRKVSPSAQNNHCFHYREYYQNK